MNIRPLHDRVIVKRKDAENKTSSGIIIPDNAKEKPQEGKVIATGSGIRKEDGSVLPLDVKKGDKILFGKYAGVEIKIEGEDYLMMKEEDILGIIK
jgi:chaperonin GroES